MTHPILIRAAARKSLFDAFALDASRRNDDDFTHATRAIEKVFRIFSDRIIRRFAGMSNELRCTAKRANP
jgi:hypothetical protein